MCVFGLDYLGFLCSWCWVDIGFLKLDVKILLCGYFLFGVWRNGYKLVYRIRVCVYVGSDHCDCIFRLVFL